MYVYIYIYIYICIYMYTYVYIYILRNACIKPIRLLKIVISVNFATKTCGAI